MTSDLRSVGRAIDILEYLSRHPDDGVSAVARHLGIDKSTVSRQLACLEDRHYVLRNPDTGKFRLGYKLLALGRTVEEASDIRSAALPAMRRLRDETGESVGLFARHGLNRVCLEQVPGRDPVRRIFAVGEVEELWPLGSAGRVLTAFAPASEKAFLLQHLRHAGADYAQLANALHDVVETGHAITQGERIAGCGGISAPIFDFREQCVGVLNLGIPLTRWVEDVIPVYVHAVRCAAVAISRLMGEPTGAGEGQ